MKKYKVTRYFDSYPENVIYCTCDTIEEARLKCKEANDRVKTVLIRIIISLCMVTRSLIINRIEQTKVCCEAIFAVDFNLNII